MGNGCCSCKEGQQEPAVHNPAPEPQSTTNDQPQATQPIVLVQPQPIQPGPFVVLQPPPERICATEARFCLSQPVILHLRENMLIWAADDFRITDATNGTLYFQCTGAAFSFHGQKVLTDNIGHPILLMQNALVSFTHKYKVFYIADTPHRELLMIESRFVWVGSKLSTIFNDTLNGSHRYIVLRGDWRDKNCVICLGDPDAGGSPLAKIYRPWTERSMFGADDYLLEVATGVDIALMVVLCIALDEHAHDSHKRRRRLSF